MVNPYPRERRLTLTAALVAALFWLGLALLWLRIADRYLAELTPAGHALLFAALLILTHAADFLARAARVAWWRGHAVEITAHQHPDLHARVRNSAKRLGIETVPHAFLFHEPQRGASDSLRLLGEGYLALNGEHVGALTERQGAIDFYIGYELARLRDRSGRLAPWLLPARVLPLLGPAYERAKVYTYDRYGLAACKTAVDAALALALLASGSRRWKSLRIADFAAQGQATAGLWMSAAELVAPQPWLAKRLAQLRTLAAPSDALVPRRHPLAFLLALLVPCLSPRLFPALLRLATLTAWLALGISGAELAARGLGERLESRLDNRVVRVTLPPPSRTSAPPATAADETTSVEAQPYAAVNADLRLLGEAAEVRSRRLDSIVCEIDNLRALSLNFRAERYAFSCNEPVVYTVVEASEFEPGRPSFLHSYNWKEKHFQAAATASSPIEPKPLAPVPTP